LSKPITSEKVEGPKTKHFLTKFILFWITLALVRIMLLGHVQIPCC